MKQIESYEMLCGEVYLFYDSEYYDIAIGKVGYKFAQLIGIVGWGLELQRVIGKTNYKVREIKDVDFLDVEYQNMEIFELTKQEVLNIVSELI